MASRRTSKNIPIDKFTEQLQVNYQTELLREVMAVVYKKGFEFQCEEDVHRFFKDQVTKTIHDDGTTTLFVNKQPLCAYGPLVVKQNGDEIDTSFAFAQL